ncbi:chaperone NapD [Bordetella petrii]|uniref:chaperone NapD n=1 Tax=Bordetella petrii TaxID=94624 RepID=UPI001E64BC39|nr:chaperone NapD [Bordetella petrii]MCD0501416.1 chaperone NapD [Bordetella petrii]
MRIASLVLRIPPEQISATRQVLATIAGVQVHAHDSATGKVIVTIEDGPGYSTADSILAVHKVPCVLSATLAYEYGDPDTPLAGESSLHFRPPALGASPCH